MGKTSSAVHNRYRKKAYDLIQVAVPKGCREIYKSFAESQGESLAGMFRRLVDAEISATGWTSPILAQTPDDGIQVSTDGHVG